MSLVYIASKFPLKGEVEKLKEKLHEAGHLVTVEWWNYEGKKVLEKLPNDEFYSDPRTKFLKERDLFGIEQCDVFVLLSGPAPLSFNGANFELGYATALRKNCYIIGKLDRSALYAGITFCESTSEFLLLIGDK